MYEQAQDDVASAAGSRATFSPVVELRQYTLHPGKRDALIDVFDNHLVEPQEETGMKVIGQFRDLNRPDRFVWLRGFDDMESRRASLSAFYGGPVWAEHKDAANATMISSDDVLLFGPAWPGSAFDLAGAERGRRDPADAIVTARIFHIEPAGEGDFVEFFRNEAAPLLADLGAPLLAAFVTEHAENSFPRLPVRADENVFVAFFRFADAAAHARYETALADSAAWQGDLLPRLQRHFSRQPETLRLARTERSLL
ncbi:NIPSNAP family protein [Allomesorhizobium camelthorni]|uniref:NIPSNAP family protein n=1 Tax=Allomesorhizobium camelthorni TaxID=475069 RepID=A0A6G4WD59_9HYPH|nr:NIPSNAP family protein [Mesorhizobium camelthorni]NGO52524.1 NIPSNAP family protein [Mesorhizobium camelthorni]